MEVTEEAGRAGRGGELIQKFRILQVFLVFSLIEILYRLCHIVIEKRLSSQIGFAQ